MQRMLINTSSQTSFIDYLGESALKWPLFKSIRCVDVVVVMGFGW